MKSVIFKRTRLPVAVTFLLLAGLPDPASGQVYRVGAGLSFASAFEFNSVEVGNPGLKVKTWISLDRRNKFHIVPTLSAFNRNRLDAGYFSVTNYMFMGDLDAQFRFYRERTLKIIGFGGANLTYVSSTVTQNDPRFPIPDFAPGDETGMAVGANLGAGLELRMTSRFDMNVSVKYILSKYSQFLISVEGVYYFKSRRRAYRR